ncbi:MAG: tRNA 2-thiouridine(34) synthase MnmA [Patescibacteria group bacterium]|mgnify:CR=1 FL=1
MAKGKMVKKKVFVGLSGGVDSSVSAALLKKAGYNVHGVFIKVWQPDWIECTWKEDRLDAMRVCAKLGIPFQTLNLEKEYKKEVADYMIREYKLGRTPNPDVMCNKHVKFGGFYNWAMKQGADFVATGHYAQIMEHGARSTEQKKQNQPCASGYELRAACDGNKDQSYFLWQIKKEQLSHILFPVGNIEKPEVRKLAKKFGLVTADKKDSQGLCFLGKIDVKEFLKKYIKPKQGKVLNENGLAIGYHDGAPFFTVGERRGFTITKKTPGDMPYYVIAKDIKENILTVSNNPRASLAGDSRKVFKLERLNWLGDGTLPHTGLTARLRYRQVLQKCTLEIKRGGKTATVSFSDTQDGGAPGQSIVIYKGDQCLAGGIVI